MSRTTGLPADARSPCPVANALDLIGDRWSLLIVRDLLPGPLTYGELQAAPERMPTNVLAARLRMLEADGLVRRTPYHVRPVRYRYALTPKGRTLGPTLRALARWGLSEIPGTMTRDDAMKRLRK